MKTALFLFPFYVIQVCLSLPVTGKKYPRRQNPEMKIVDNVWPVPRYHFVNAVIDGQKDVYHVSLEDKGSLQYAKQLAVFRRKKRCSTFECFDAKATDTTPSTTTSTTPPPPAQQETTTTQATTTPTTKATTPATQSSGPTNSGSKIKFPFPFPFSFSNFPKPKFPKFPWFS